MIGKKVKNIGNVNNGLTHLGVKVPQFSFSRLHGADPVLSVEMASTGEVACLGNDLSEAFLKSLFSVGFVLPKKSILLSTGPLYAKAELLDSKRALARMGFRFYATKGTADFMKENSIESEVLHWPLEKKEPTA